MRRTNNRRQLGSEVPQVIDSGGSLCIIFLLFGNGLGFSPNARGNNGHSHI